MSVRTDRNAAGFQPIKIQTIDVERCPEVIDAVPGYAALWALARERGRPRGMIRLPFDSACLSREQLLEAIEAQAPAVSAPVLTADLRAPSLARSFRLARGGEDARELGLPRVSIVIPSMLERRDTLDACLASLARLEYPDYEVIVVDNRRAGSPPVELEHTTVVAEPQPGISAARNRGLAIATGEIIAFTDDDVVVDPKWLLAIALRFREHPEEACVTGLAMPGEVETPAQQELEEYYGGFGPRHYEPVSHRMRSPRGWRNLLRPATVDAVGVDGTVRRSFSLYATGSFGLGANMAFRADALRRMGGFDRRLGTGTPCRGGEDLAMFARLAWRGVAIGFEPAAIVHHTHRRDTEALERQVEGNGLGYGALLAALILEDPRHIGRMAGTARRAIREMILRYGQKLDANQPAADRHTQELAKLELRGMAVGPLTYLRSRLRRLP
jgi:GT2 family glycosyltransferase